MLNAQSFKKGLVTLTTSVGAFQKLAQSLVLYCILQNFEGNSNSTLELLQVLTKPDPKNAGKFLYQTADAERLMKYIAEFSPIIIYPSTCAVKLSKTRLQNGLVMLKEEEYPLWHEHSRVGTPNEVKEQDGLAVLVGLYSGVIDKIKKGKLKITADSRPVFDAALHSIEEVLKSNKTAVSKKIDAELNQTRKPVMLDNPAVQLAA